MASETLDQQLHSRPQGTNILQLATNSLINSTRAHVYELDQHDVREGQQHVELMMSCCCTTASLHPHSYNYMTCAAAQSLPCHQYHFMRKWYQHQRRANDRQTDIKILLSQNHI